MRQHRGVPDEEGPAVVAAAADEVVDRLERLPADREPLVAVPLPLRHALGEPSAGKVSLPPLAGLQAFVAAVGQQPWQERPFLEVPVHRFAAGGEGRPAFRASARNPRVLGRIVADDPVLVRQPAGDDRGEARAAEAAGHVAKPVDETLPRQPVEVRRAEVLMSHEAVVAPVLVVGDDEHDVAMRGTACVPRADGRFRRWNSVAKAEERRHGHRTHRPAWRSPSRRIPSHRMPSLVRIGRAVRRIGPSTALPQPRACTLAFSPHPASPRLGSIAGLTIIDGRFSHRSPMLWRRRPRSTATNRTLPCASATLPPRFQLVPPVW